MSFLSLKLVRKRSRMFRSNFKEVYMKKLLRLLLFLGVFFVCNPVFAQSEDRILEYKSVIDVKKSTDMHVIETITFQPNIFLERHGIEWSIPYVYSTSAFRRPTQLSINSVIYYPLSNIQNSIENKYTRSDENGWAKLRIGDPNIVINEPYIYVIDYSMKYTGVSYFDTHDELYLNIIGPGWNFPIDNAYATLTLPGDITEAVCYTGPDGSEEQNCTYEINGNILTVKPNGTLNSYEGYTVAVKLPKGTFDDTRAQQRKDMIIANMGILIPIPVGIILFVLLKDFRKGKKYTVIPQYKPLKGFDVLSSSLLIKDSLKENNKAVSAMLIEMAVKGYYKIREYEDKKYEFVKQKEFTNESEHGKTIMNKLFAIGDTVQMSKLSEFSNTTITALSQVRSFLKNNGYVSSSKKNIKQALTAISLISFFFLFQSLPVFISSASIGTYLGILVSLILLVIFSTGINIRTDKGDEAYAYLMGLKMYIDTAEDEKIKFHNDPEKYKGVFEKLLPYAMIFNLEKKWAKVFEDLYTTPPQWYEGRIDRFNTYVFIDSLSRFNRTVYASSLPPSRSYSSSGGYRSGGWSSGGSGFGGGGSSGGGGGGSSGGAW